MGSLDEALQHLEPQNSHMSKKKVGEAGGSPASSTSHPAHADVVGDKPAETDPVTAALQEQLAEAEEKAKETAEEARAQAAASESALAALKQQLDDAEDQKKKLTEAQEAQKKSDVLKHVVDAEYEGADEMKSASGGSVLHLEVRDQDLHSSHLAGEL